MKVIFLGTPEFAVPSLDALITDKHISVQAVITQPDRQAHRGQKLHSPPVKILAEKHLIPVLQPEKLSRAPAVVQTIKNYAPDLIVMVAYGQILKPEFLAIPKLGVMNVHASLLPVYRGAAPINWAIINGDTTTGITTMFTEAGLDTGPILLKEEMIIDPDINAGELSKKMALLGADLLLRTIGQLQSGTIIPQPQDNRRATYAPLLSKTLGHINWSKPASTIHNLVRGLNPWPIAYTNFHDYSIKIWCTKVLDNQEINKMISNAKHFEPGTVIHLSKQLLVACGEKTWLELKEVQPANKPKLPAHDWANGMRIQSGEKFVD